MPAKKIHCTRKIYQRDCVFFLFAALSSLLHHRCLEASRVIKQGCTGAETDADVLSLQGHPSPSRVSSQGSLDSSCAMPFVSSRRMPHLGGIAAGTQAPQLRGIHEGSGMEPEPDIDMPEAGTPTSESDSEEAEGDSLFFPGQDKGMPLAESSPLL